MQHHLPGSSPEYVIASRHQDKEEQSQSCLLRPISSLFPSDKKNIITAHKNDHIASTFKKLIDNNILSCPVYDVKEHKYIGFIDMVDMVSHVLSVCQEAELMGGELSQILETQERFANSQSGSIADLSKRNPWKPVDKKTPITSAVDLMVRWKVHRIPVVDSDGELLTLVTQSQVCQYIHNSIDSISIAKKTVKDLKLGLQVGSVISVGLQAKVFTAFRLMHDQHISAVAVVNDAGELVGNVSVSDLKLIGYDGKLMHRLFTTVEEFLKLISPNETFGVGPIAVADTATYEEVVAKMVLAKIHRVYVVDLSNKKPIGVISQGEILQALRS